MSTHEAQRAALPVLIDVDTGADDALALLLALTSQQLEVRGITCVAGNQRLPQVVANTLMLVEALGVDVPVAAGMDRPLVGGLQPLMPLHGRDGMADLGLPSPRRAADTRHAVEFLRHQLATAASPVTIVGLAPLTNLAVLIRMYPELLAKISTLVVMGGTLADAGNTTPAAEFNIRHDPEAAAIVLGSGLPIVLYPLDVFRRIAFSAPEIAAMQQCDVPAAQYAGRVLEHLRRYFGTEAALIGDAGAVAVTIAPELGTRVAYPVAVELAGSLTRGQTVVDRREVAARARLSEWWHVQPPVVEIVETVDVPGCRRLFAATLGAGAALTEAGDHVRFAE